MRQSLAVQIVELVLCMLVLLVFLAIYLSKRSLTRWSPRVPEAPEYSVQRPESNTKGDGNVVLLIHGLGSSPAVFPEADCIKPLLDEGHTVVLPTYRHRKDGPPVSLSRVLTHSLLACLPRDALPVTIETMAADLVVLIHEQGWKHVHVVGHSMGGMVAQALAIEIPDRIASLTCVGACTGPGLGPCAPRFIQLIRDGVRVMFWKRFQGNSDGLGLQARNSGEWGQRQIAAIITARGRARKLDALVRRGWLHAPMLAVSGDLDTQVSPKSAAASAHRITGCRSIVVGGMKHTPVGVEWTDVIRLAGLVGNHNVHSLTHSQTKRLKSNTTKVDDTIGVHTENQECAKGQGCGTLSLRDTRKVTSMDLDTRTVTDPHNGQEHPIPRPGVADGCDPNSTL
jgi:pimeloyl-ACP methyl ester carboxylesterase